MEVFHLQFIIACCYSLWPGM